ncbi:MAG: transglycosylase SLT domain-containing protein [Synechococcus sp.]
MSGDRQVQLWLSGTLGLGLLALVGGMGVGLLQLQSTPPSLAQSLSTPDRSLMQATEALRLGRAQQSLQLLEDLESQLPELSDRVVMLRAMAYEAAASPVAASNSWQQILDDYPNSPIVPKALLGLKRINEMLSRFPDHPVTIEYLQEAIEQQPQNFAIVRHLAAVAPESKGLTPHLNRWVEARQIAFTADDRQVVADAYWAQREYGKASRAYQPTAANPQNLYRLGRSHQISREPTAAIAAYQKLLAQFPTADEAGQTRLKLAELVNTNAAIALLRQEADRNSEDSATALRNLSRLYARIGNATAASTTRQHLWQQYPQTAAAATEAWEIATQRAKAGNLSGAIELAQQIGTRQADTEWGAQLNFWSGKWMNQQGNSAGAASAYQKVLQEARSSYYAWRAASLLGLPAGDFKSGRTPVNIQYQPSILQLPGASAAVQRLHIMGDAEAAWQRWQWETYDRAATTQSVFVGGVLQNRSGEYLDRLSGINAVASLIQKAEEGDVTAHQLQQRPDFWQTVYPLHHYERLIAEAESFSLNPLVMAGLIRQESRFEPEIVSHSGALGLTQVMPATGAWIAQKVGRSVYNLKTPNDNLHFGAWYLDYTHRSYDNNSMLAIASYNAGPGNVAKWTQRYSLADPDAFVEQIPFPETRKYVKAVLGNYWNYLQLYAPNTNNLANMMQAIATTPNS